MTTLEYLQLTIKQKIWTRRDTIFSYGIFVYGDENNGELRDWENIADPYLTKKIIVKNQKVHKILYDSRTKDIKKY